jgi:hypothetical protein
MFTAYRQQTVGSNFAPSYSKPDEDTFFIPFIVVVFGRTP